MMRLVACVVGPEYTVSSGRFEKLLWGMRPANSKLLRLAAKTFGLSKNPAEGQALTLGLVYSQGTVPGPRCAYRGPGTQPALGCFAQ